jgi:hypothetical protein
VTSQAVPGLATQDEDEADRDEIVLATQRCAAPGSCALPRGAASVNPASRGSTRHRVTLSGLPEAGDIRINDVGPVMRSAGNEIERVPRSIGLFRQHFCLSGFRCTRAPGRTVLLRRELRPAPAPAESKRSVRLSQISSA